METGFRMKCNNEGNSKLTGRKRNARHHFTNNTHVVSKASYHSGTFPVSPCTHQIPIEIVMSKTDQNYSLFLHFIEFI